MKYANLEDAKNYEKLKKVNKKLIKSEKINIFQNDEFDNTLSYCIEVGNFFELVTKAIYGGERNIDLGDKSIQPDLIIKIIKMIEVKSSRLNGQIDISVHQMERYLESDYDVYYALYKYMIGKPMKYLKEKNIVKEISKNIGFMIYMPINFLIDLKDNGKEFITFYNHPDKNLLMRIHSRGLKKLIIDPIKAVKEMGLRSSAYKFEKRIMPDGVIVEKNEINQFPILIIRERFKGPF